MVWSRIIFSLLSSLLLISCSSGRVRRAPTVRQIELNKQTLRPFIPDSSASKYRATIDVLNRHFSGILIVKKVSETESRAAFVTELGMRMFELLVRGDSLTVDYAFEPLQRPSVLQALKVNFSDLMLVWLKDRKADLRYVAGDSCYVVHTEKKKMIAVTKDQNNFAVTQNVYVGRKKTARAFYTAQYSDVKYSTRGLVKLRIRLIELGNEESIKE